MAEVLVQFDDPCHAATGRSYVAQVCGQPIGNGLWEGWIQFMPTDGGDPVRTRRETEQLSRGDLRYWAAGLTRDRLNASLSSTLNEVAHLRVWNGPAPLAFDDIDPEERIVFDSAAMSPVVPAIDPFALYAQGPHVLQRELRVLDAAQLRAIVSAYNIPDSELPAYVRTFEEALAQRIVAEVQHRVEGGHPPVARLGPKIRRHDSGISR